MALKKVIRCKDCANRVYDIGVGFTAKTMMLCGFIGCEVDDDDGCTFGDKGDGRYACREYDVTLDSYAAINGCYEWEVME